MKFKIGFLSLVFSFVSAFPRFQDGIPNGANVILSVVDEEGEVVETIPWPGLGHDDPNGGGTRNVFGQDVEANIVGRNPDWPTICSLDSDGDGLTNGFELGDENCEWESSNDDFLLRKTDITHPAFVNEEPVELNTETAIKIHATFMILAWFFFAPVGILTAVYFKVKKKEDQKFLGFHWFTVHKFCLSTTVIFTFMAYIVMVQYKGAILMNSNHTLFGHFVLFLTVVQPIGGLLRVHIEEDGSKSDRRLKWELFHQWTGRFLLLCAFINVVLGFDASPTIPSSRRNTMKALAWILLTLIGLSSLIYAFVRVDERKKVPQVSVNGRTKTESLIRASNIVKSQYEYTL